MDFTPAKFLEEIYRSIQNQKNKFVNLSWRRNKSNDTNATLDHLCFQFWKEHQIYQVIANSFFVYTQYPPQNLIHVGTTENNFDKCTGEKSKLEMFTVNLVPGN